ncbi:MAG: SUMF1/EgtB/PvdO family nonheme iron enzyme [Candidatus Delongbacteria bacterium]|jgi:formylglycine-generating enzyme required for sulfatase activity|nr:SUMF1/EgtB/PvdO family nonheme iron enzyme [Candidatus Delongbacteria bacterium]
MKRFIAITTTIITLILVWACSDYEHTNPFHPDYGDVKPLQNLTLEVQKVDHIKVIWDSDYLNDNEGYKFQVDRKVGDDNWVEQYKLFNSDTYTFVDSSAGIDQTNQYRVSVAFDENLSEPAEETVFNEFIPPADLNLTNINLSTILVRWSDNSNGEDGFQIDRYSEGSWSDSIAVLLENRESWVDSTVVLNDSVQYRVSAFRNGVNSAETVSNLVNTKIPAPGNFKTQPLNISTIKLTWIDNSNGEDGFQIEKKIAIDSWQPIQTTSADSVSWTDDNAEVNEVLQYRIYAFKGSDTSDFVEVPMFNNIFPAPSNLFLDQLNLNTIKLDWIDNSDGEDGFKIDKRDNAGNWIYDFATISADIETWTDSPTDIYDTLAYRIKAYKDVMASNFTEATMNDINFPPPTDLIMTREGLSRLKFDWSEISVGEDEFIIDKKIDDATWVTNYGNVGPNITTWTDSIAQVNHDLAYRIYGRSGSNFSNYAVSDIIDNSIPAPSNLTYEQMSLNSISFEWADNSIDEEGFSIDKFVNDVWTNSYATVGTNSTGYIDMTAEINEDIVYKVRAYYGSEFSDPTDTGIINNLFPAPSNLTADVSGMNITLNWDENSTGEAGFKIDRKYNGGVWVDDYASVASNIVTWNETVVDTGKYYYRVKGFLGEDVSGLSEDFEVWLQFNLNPPSNIYFEKVSIDTISLTWDDNSDNEDGFVIDKKIGINNWIENFTSVNSNITSWSDNNAEINTNLQYRVKSYIEQYYSSASITPIIDNTIPSPSNLSGDINLLDVTLGWEDNSNGEDGFKIDRKYDGDPWIADYATIGSNIITWNETVADTGKYYYRVKAFIDTDMSVTSNEVELYNEPFINELIFVQGGTFEMGDHFNEGYARELPVHSVILSDFNISKYEITQSEWWQYMPADTYSSGTGIDYPVYWVSWYEALVYCNKRSMAEGKTPCYTISSSTNPNDWGSIPTSSNSIWDQATCDWVANGYRLPTEAEWEYAARGGIHNTDNYHYSGGNTLSYVGWYITISNETTHPVGTKNSNQLGIFDMSGNVREWCWDKESDYYYTECDNIGTVTDPNGSTSGTRHYHRGGDWFYDADKCRVAYRDHFDPYFKTNSVGFRVVMLP